MNETDFLSDRFDAALRLYSSGHGSASLTNILSFAANITSCRTTFVSILYPDEARIIFSVGLPLSELHVSLPRYKSLGLRLRQPTIIPDLLSDPDLAGHPLVHGPLGFRFLASAPLPFGVLPQPALLICADPDNSIPRQPDLLEKVGQCARIFADNLGLMGDVATLRERITKARAPLANLPTLIEKAALPIGLLDADGSIITASQQLVDLLPIGSAPAGPWVVRDLFPEFSASLETVQNMPLDTGNEIRVMAVRSDGRPLMSHIIALPGRSVDDRKFLFLLDDQTETQRALNMLCKADGESPMVVGRFLLDTLIRQPRVRRRGAIRYHVLTRWRRDVQAVQVAALRALKADLPSAFVSEVASQLASEAIQLFGRNTFQRIVPVPCGNSGPACLSAQLAAAVSQILGVPMIDAFEPIPVRGSSHPRRNANRPRLNLVQPVDVPVLLIDDVATSGHHVAEAACRLLAGGAPAVLPLVWTGQ